MLSPELLRRYPFFAGLSMDQIRILAMAGEELDVPKGHVLFDIHASLNKFYLVISGEIGICVEKPRQGAHEDTLDQAAPETDIISLINSGEIFGWSSLFPPFAATAGAKALVPSRVAVFDAKDLLEAFENDPCFGYQMMQKLAQIVHFRLRDRRLELLADKV